MVKLHSHDFSHFERIQISNFKKFFEIKLDKKKMKARKGMSQIRTICSFLATMNEWTNTSYMGNHDHISLSNMCAFENYATVY